MQKVDRMAYKLDRRTLIDPDLVMSSHQDLSFMRPSSAPKSQPQSNSSLVNDMYQQPSVLGSEGGLTQTDDSPRIPLPNSATAMLHQYLSGRPPESI